MKTSSCRQSDLTGWLQVRELSFWFDERELPVVHRCSFDVAPNEFVAIMGASGCGKSTLLRIVSGLMHSYVTEYPESGYKLQGKVLWGGKPVRAPVAEFAYVPQNFSITLMPALTAEENVQLAVRAEGISQDKCAMAKHLMEQSNIYDQRGVKVRQLSGGQQQRVAICRALITRPRLLFMDEPFANLDPTLMPEMSKLLQTLSAESKNSLLFVTHDLSHAKQIANRIIVVDVRQGRPLYRNTERSEFETLTLG
jgi:ABC-type nitrate/sulfonate/bicarbonate transport system ATPase subunit